jgi:hypothetical protein
MNLFAHKWLPRFFYKKFDGGKESGVTGYFLIEWKRFFSIGILHFKQGSRENYHSHAFNALTWFLKGTVTEEKYTGEKKDFGPSIWPKSTPRTNIHRVVSHSDTWALTFRGPWEDVWYEYRPKDGKLIYLTHGRTELRETDN